MMSIWIACVASIGVAAAGAPALSQAALTEAEAARLATAGPEWAGAAAARRAALQARAATAGLRPNPELEAAREGGEGLGGDGTEDSVQLTYPLDLGGARRAQRQAGRARLQADLVEVEEGVVDRAISARRLFHEVSGLARREAALGRRVALLDTALDITRRRFNEGDVPELELRRLELEAGAARAEQQQTTAERAGAWERLSALVGAAASPPPAPPETPPALAGVDTYLALVEQSPAVRRAAAETATAEAEALAARRERGFADTAVFGGLRSIDDRMGRATGVILGGRVGLPVLGGGRARLQAELAEATAARAEQRLLLEQRGRSVIAAYATAARLQDAAREAEAVSALRDRVFAPARAAWEGGEIELTELLNIYRTANEAEVAAIDLARKAAVARVELDALVGKIEP